MRQAILITAYKNIEQLLEIINYFPSSFNFYVHADRRSLLEPKLIKVGRKNVHVYKKYLVNWGGYNHLQAIAFLAREALKEEGNGFFHLISGQDFPIRPVNFFENHLDLSRDYLDFFPLPAERWSGNGGLERIQYFNFYDLINAKKNKRWIDELIKWQKLLGISRSLPSYFPQLYGGSTWWSLTRSTLQFALEGSENNKKFFRRMRFTYCSEEIYFHTVILNSTRYASNVINDGLRYIDWESGKGGYPAFLDETDFSIITSMGKIFARKFEPHILSRLKSYLSTHLPSTEDRLKDAG